VTVRDQIVRDRCATCGAPIKPAALSVVVKQWVFSLGLFAGVTILFYLAFS
jgi:hypothetical protein